MGRVEVFHLPIDILGQSPRTVYAYLPDAYDKHPKMKFPVLYMFDGHNLFSDETATYGKSWGIKDYLDESGLPLVVIGVDCNHTGNYRLCEYCPYPITAKHKYGDIIPYGKQTGEWFVNILKPACEKRYHISDRRENTGIAGSSMGGLMSLYMISHYNHIYSKAACLSPTMILNYPKILSGIQKAAVSKDTKIYLDYGSDEVRSKSALTKVMDQLLKLSHAFEEHGAATYPRIIPKGTHCEACWEKAVPVFLEYLFFPK